MVFIKTKAPTLGRRFAFGVKEQWFSPGCSGGGKRHFAQPDAAVGAAGNILTQVLTRAVTAGRLEVLDPFLSLGHFERPDHGGHGLGGFGLIKFNQLTFKTNPTSVEAFRPSFAMLFSRHTLCGI